MEWSICFLFLVWLEGSLEYYDRQHERRISVFQRRSLQFDEARSWASRLEIANMIIFFIYNNDKNFNCKKNKSGLNSLFVQFLWLRFAYWANYDALVTNETFTSESFTRKSFSCKWFEISEPCSERSVTAIAVIFNMFSNAERAEGFLHTFILTYQKLDQNSGLSFINLMCWSILGLLLSHIVLHTVRQPFAFTE